MKEEIHQLFLDYVKHYDVNDERVQLKITHTFHVANHAETIARMLKLTRKEQMIAYCIGMFHDLARFEQLKRYDTFVDAKSVDHGDLGVVILKECGFLDQLGLCEQEQELIYEAILNHNK